MIATGPGCSDPGPRPTSPLLPLRRHRRTRHRPPRSPLQSRCFRPLSSPATASLPRSRRCPGYPPNAPLHLLRPCTGCISSSSCVHQFHHVHHVVVVVVVVVLWVGYIFFCFGFFFVMQMRVSIEAQKKKREKRNKRNQMINWRIELNFH